ncbi:MAG: hypothetical protein JF606_17675 [Burkholderiales bacterium]|nr:hypothetical protein [Burkholderiales bacterium]
MSAVRMLADDLTGALDAGARLASLDPSLCICWGCEAPCGEGGSVADTETRNLPWSRARTRLERSIGLLAGGEVAFKKCIDGNVVSLYAARQQAAALPAGQGWAVLGLRAAQQLAKADASAALLSCLAASHCGWPARATPSLRCQTQHPRREGCA